MKKLRVAIIGQGRSGRDIHGAYFKSESNTQYEVVYVVESDPSRRERAEREYPGCKALSDYKELYEKRDVDLVVNASYSEMHYPITYDLLSNGFNVLVEKPFARNRYECDVLMELAKKKGVVLAVFQQTFLAPFYKFAKNLVESGKLGQIKQVDLCYNGFARRWDWQTLQSKMAGCVYNTGPHPIGLALGFLDFDDNAELVFSRISNAFASGDAEDYAKMILTAPNKPVVDVEIVPIDAYKDYNLKIYGTKGTYKSTTSKYQMTYVVDGENPPRPVIFESLKKEDGTPMYCGEKLVKHTEEGEFSGTAFNTAVSSFYSMLYDTITEGKELTVTPEMAARIINIIEKVHADNPMPITYL